MINLKLTTLAINWNTRKLSTFFPLKYKNLYPACKMFYDKVRVVWITFENQNRILPLSGQITMTQRTFQNKQDT